MLQDLGLIVYFFQYLHVRCLNIKAPHSFHCGGIPYQYSRETIMISYRVTLYHIGDLDWWSQLQDSHEIQQNVVYTIGSLHPLRNVYI